MIQQCKDNGYLQTAESTHAIQGNFLCSRLIKTPYIYGMGRIRRAHSVMVLGTALSIKKAYKLTAQARLVDLSH